MENFQTVIKDEGETQQSMTDQTTNEEKTAVVVEKP